MSAVELPDIPPGPCLLSAAVMHAEIACERVGAQPLAAALHVQRDTDSVDTVYVHLTFHNDRAAAAVAQALGLDDLAPGVYSAATIVNRRPVVFVAASAEHQPFPQNVY